MGHKAKSGLPIVALVLASLFFVPLCPLAGLILGCIALARGGARTPAIVAICLGAVFTVASVAAASALVAGARSVQEGSKIAEANRELGALAHALGALDAPGWQALPDADWTPALPACARPAHVWTDSAAAWQTAPWSSLGFAPAGPHRYQYRLRRDGVAIIVEARADLDCRGRVSEVSARVLPGGDGDVRFTHQLR